MTTEAYSIKRIRLLNFHNFVNETIDLKDGGHLFLLGDNGCGKTTILDAVHYVLTAGKEMEWNSAARLSGPKRDGRRVQGIVLRYNIDTGPLNNGGAITYAALEIAGRHGKPLTIGIGISATAMDERIGFWGFIKECTLDDLPFTTSENDQIRPSSRQEFKQKLESSHGFYTNQTAYRKELADRLFGGEESYLDICRFLSMGKSYREISAGAADYHQLFKSLLPEPRSSIFEQIIVALQSLDESQALLNDLKRKLDWLHGLRDKIDSISEFRQGELRYAWLLHHFIIEQTQDEELRCRENIDRTSAELAAYQGHLIELERRGLDIEGRLHALQIKDSAGLVLQEKHCQTELQQKQQVLVREQEEGKDLRIQLKSGERKLLKARDTFDKLLKRLQPELARRSAALPFSLNELQTEIDTISRSKNPETLPLPSPQPTLSQCDEHLQTIIAEKAILLQSLRQIEEGILTHQQEITHLEKRQDLVPQVAGFEAFEQMLKNNMISFRPLFQGLEWSPALKQQQRNFIEQCIGEEILATLLFRSSEYSRVRELCTGFPGLRICQPLSAVSELPQWILNSFDLRECDPDCLRALAMEIYLKDKGVEGYGLKQDSRGNLLIPGFDLRTGHIQTLQWIESNGAKRFEYGCPQHGSALVIPSPELSDNGEIFLAEGYATAASIHMATGQTVVAAFTAHNLLPVAEILREQYPDSEITICADNDHHLVEQINGTPIGNVGLRKAKEAAEVIGANVVAPSFNREEMLKRYTDFNDLHKSRGLDAVAKQVNAQVVEVER